MNSSKLLPPPPPPPITGLISRKALLFTSLITLIFCMILSLSLASCDDDYRKEAKPFMWEQLRNTAWTMDRTITENGTKYTITYTIGFYGPGKGPFSYGYGNPYTVIRVYSKNGPEWLPSGNYIFTNFDITISRTGDKILEYRPEDYYTGVNSGGGSDYEDKAPPPQVSPEYPYEPDYPDDPEYSISPASRVGFGVWGEPERSSFNFSISDNTLTISSVKLGSAIQVNDAVYYGFFDENYNIVNSDNFTNFTTTVRRINGTYTKLSDDPTYAFNEGMQEFWPKVKNTAWAKQGSSTPSVGFYEIDKGPSSQPGWIQNDYYGYLYLLTPDGASKKYLYKSMNKDGFSIDTGDVSFRISVSNNTISISGIYTENVWTEGDIIVPQPLRFYNNPTGQQHSPGDPFTEYNLTRLRGAFENTYTKISSDPSYSWYE
jgi:hypothetical protein